MNQALVGIFDSRIGAVRVIPSPITVYKVHTLAIQVGRKAMRVQQSLIFVLCVVKRTGITC
jgi:hypothetical protein